MVEMVPLTSEEKTNYLIDGAGQTENNRRKILQLDKEYLQKTKQPRLKSY